MLDYTINSFLKLRLENGRTNIYVNNKLFMHCKYLLLSLPIEKIENLEGIDSIDDFIEKNDNIIEIANNINLKISPKTIFWAHCSNLHVWYENGYNSGLIHSNLAFPLLKELTMAGDKLAASVFKDLLAKRFEKGNLKVKNYILKNCYLNYLNKEELSVLLTQAESYFIKSGILELKKKIKFSLLNYREIKELIDLLLFIDLKYNQKYIFSMLHKLNRELRPKFARFLILHLNYKEFNNYKIAYGRFITYFEELIAFLYNNYPEISEFLRVIDSGFINSNLSLDDRRSYGFVSYL